MSRSTFLMGLTLAGGLLCACNLNQSSSDEEPPGEVVTPPASATLPGSGSSSSQSSTPAPTSASDASSDASADGGAKDGGNSNTKSDASSDAAKDSSSALIPFGAPCLLSVQCATGLCLPYEGKGLRCTKTCNSDDDCPDDNECGDAPRVCEID